MTDSPASRSAFGQWRHDRLMAKADRTGLRRRPRWRRFLRKSVRVTSVLVLSIPVFVGTAGAAGAYLLLFGGLPGTVPVEKPPKQAIPSVVYDADGNQIAEFRQFDLTLPMAKEQVPEVLKEAVIASEDQRFWEHRGMDPEGVARAAVAISNEGEVVQGGSTITQQLVRRKYLNNDRIYERKFNEVLLATRLERDLIDEYDGDVKAAKEQILFEYLEGTYFGGGAYGAAAAAQTYFHTTLENLTLSQAALMAGVIPSPSRYGPREFPVVANERRLDTLRLMLEQGRITPEQHDTAAAEHLWWDGFGPPTRPATVIYPPPKAGASTYPYFVDYVRQYLIERYGEDAVYKQGLRVDTTIDPRLQEMAERNVRDALSGVAWPMEMSLVTVEPGTGFVKSLVGGRDFNFSQVNLALGPNYGFQPGSSFKPFVVARALEDGYGPDTVYATPDVVTIGGTSFKGGGGGALDMAAATAGSINTYFVQLANDVGPDKVAEMAYRLGVNHIKPNAKHTVDIALGSEGVSPLEMAAAYGVFANHGVKADATPVTRVVKSDGQVLEDNTGKRGVRVISSPVADWTTELLRGVTVGAGTGHAAALDDRPIAGKTGTAENNTAVWFVGYTPQLSTAIWIGDMNNPLRNTVYVRGELQFGGRVPARTWHNYMTEAMAGLPVVEFATPGVLPAPTDGELRKAERQFIPNVVNDCGGPCSEITALTSPPPPPKDEDGDGKPDPTEPPETEPTTSTSAIETTTTTRPRKLGE